MRAPERASEEALAGFLRAVLDRELTDREDILARAGELGLDLDEGATRRRRARPLARARPRTAGARACWRSPSAARAPSCPAPVAALAARTDARGAEVVVVLPGGDDAAAARRAEAILRELQSALPGHTFALGRSRPAADPVDLHRAGNEALLAANVAEGDAEPPACSPSRRRAPTACCCSAMSEDPAELQRFYAETVEPLVAYDEQYETELVQTVEAFLEADGNVAGTAQRLFTHRHTIRYRLERVRELSGLDVGSTDGREKLSLGLKAMRVLGIASPRRPGQRGRGRRRPRAARAASVRHSSRAAGWNIRPVGGGFRNRAASLPSAP